ncbi:hypothetical protein SRHO_G00332720 [Serrasalmus rhombeus]
MTGLKAASKNQLWGGVMKHQPQDVFFRDLLKSRQKLPRVEREHYTREQRRRAHWPRLPQRRFQRRAVREDMAEVGERRRGGRGDSSEVFVSPRWRCRAVTRPQVERWGQSRPEDRPSVRSSAGASENRSPSLTRRASAELRPSLAQF